MKREHTLLTVHKENNECSLQNVNVIQYKGTVNYFQHTSFLLCIYYIRPLGSRMCFPFNSDLGHVKLPKMRDIFHDSCECISKWTLPQNGADK